jgi:hypothetical protein
MEQLYRLVTMMMVFNILLITLNLQKTMIFASGLQRQKTATDMITILAYNVSLDHTNCSMENVLNLFIKLTSILMKLQLKQFILNHIHRKLWKVLERLLITVD